MNASAVPLLATLNAASRNALCAFAVALPLLLGGCSDAGRTSSGDTRQRQTLPVEVAEVRPRDLTRSVQLSAPVEALRTVRLASQTEGVVTAMHVEAGDRVTAGQTVAEIDVREARAELSRAAATQRELRANLERMRQLSEQGHVNLASVELAVTALERSDAEVELWQARVDDGRVRATLDGVVTAQHVEAGEAVGRLQPVVSLADTATLVARFGVSELDVADLQPGTEVHLRIDALRGGNALTGSVRRILPATDGPARLVTVEVQLPPEADARVRIGYLARAALVVERRDNVLAVPLGAVAASDEGHHVIVLGERDLAERRTVRPGVARGEWREITEGLVEGERVVDANPNDINEGEPLRVIGQRNGYRP